MSTQTQLVTGVDFILMPTRDLVKAADFYENVLGLERSKPWGRSIEEAVGQEFENGTVTIALFAPEKVGREFSPHQGGGVAFHVEDFEAARSELESRGVELSETIDSGVCHQAYFSDPDGNSIGIHHRYKQGAPGD